MKRLILMVLIFIYPGFWLSKKNIAKPADLPEVVNCEQESWYPGDYGLKDHHIFWHAGYYYLVSTYVPLDNSSILAQDRFVYARSIDLCNWEELSPILAERIPGSWDEAAVWAPYIHVEDGIYYLYYTGVTQNLTQSILLATSTDPSDPGSWQKHDMVFQPSHPDSLWAEGEPADCRDPFLFKHGDQYYLYYTGLDEAGGIIGVATATSPVGPWLDGGSTVTPYLGEMPESSAVVQYGNRFYLFYNSPWIGEYYRVGDSPLGPWLEASPFSPGWAHEIWLSTEGEWFTSYLTDYSITINQLIWNNGTDYPRPIIEWARAKIHLPVISISNLETD